MTFYELIVKVGRGSARRLYSAFMSTQFGAFGKGSSIYRPLKLIGLSRMNIGKRVIVCEQAWIMAENLVKGRAPSISIGDGTYIGHFCHIVAVDRMVIGENVLIANKAYFSDNVHGYRDPSVPIISQPVEFKGAVEIGDGSWIGENVAILGAKVGKHCVIGANSVVTHDIPDYCVAVGSPAAVIKKFDHESGLWMSVRGTK
jgi:acetyltransferase-like isoleucine patch superfamily enzyme